MAMSRLEEHAAEYGYKIKSYRFSDFEISVPDMFKKPGLFRGLMSGGSPELVGPNGAIISFATGRYSGTRDPKEHLKNVENIAKNQGHDVLRSDLISVAGVEHAALTVDVPLTQESYVIAPERGVRLRNYFLVFPGIECVVTCKVATMNHGTMEIHGGEGNYDDIIETFRRI